jgi:hypothetical protein
MESDSFATPLKDSMTWSQITEFHAKHFAYVLTRQYPSDSSAKVAGDLPLRASFSLLNAKNWWVEFTSQMRFIWDNWPHRRRIPTAGAPVRHNMNSAPDGTNRQCEPAARRQLEADNRIRVKAPNCGVLFLHLRGRGAEGGVGGSPNLHKRCAEGWGNPVGARFASSS